MIALEFMRINFGHDAHDFATNMLRKHLGIEPVPILYSLK